MTTLRTKSDPHRLTIAEIVDTVSDGRIPLRFTAYDGSATGPEDAPYGLHLNSTRGTTYLATAPGDLGMARAYVSGELEAIGVHPGDPYEILKAMTDLHFHRPSAKELAAITRSIGWDNLRPIAPPPQEHLPRWRRFAEGLRHSKTRDAEVIHHHYDVSNTFYEYVLGPSMTYTCAAYESEDQSLEDAQENKYRLVFDKLGLKEGDRLLDIGCGWGGMVRYAARRGVKVIERRCPASRPSGRRRRSARRAWKIWQRSASPTTATCRRPGSTPSPRSVSPSTSVCTTTRRTSGS